MEAREGRTWERPRHLSQNWRDPWRTGESGSPLSDIFFALSGNSWVPLHPHVTPSREREIKRRTASSNVFKHVLSRATWFVQNPQAPIFSTQTTPLDTKLNSPVTFLKKKLKEKQMYGFSNRNATWQRLYFKDFIRH